MPASEHLTESTTLNEAPASHWRGLIALVIVLFLISQVLIPVSYYVRGEPTSERYSWRMFSSIDLSTWDTRVTAMVEENGKSFEREVPIHAKLQETYVKTVQRAQFDIVEAFMQELAREDGVKEIRFEARGKFPSGKLMEPIRLSLRPGGELLEISN